MRHATVMVLLLALSCLGAIRVAVGQTETREPAVSPQLAARLTALKPENPEDYFLLGEEVADAAASSEQHRLAIELNCLAFELGRVRAGETATSAAAAIALAELDRTERTRRWLFAMAAVIDPSRSEPGWMRKPAPTSVESAPYTVAQLMGFVRSGDGGRARLLLSKPEVRSSLASLDRLLANGGVPGGASGLEREALKWPCPTCANKRVTRKTNTAPPEYRACSNCGGNPGAELTAEQLIGQLRIESWLLQGLQRSWAAQVATDRGEPLIDPDPSSLCALFQVDPSRPYWRDGHWCANPDCTEPPKPVPQPPAKPAPEPEPKTPKPTVAPASSAAGN